MYVEVGFFFFKINKRDSTFIREMRVCNLLTAPNTSVLPTAVLNSLNHEVERRSNHTDYDTISHLRSSYLCNLKSQV